MQIFGLLLAILWIVFFIYWIVSAMGAKKNAQRNMWWRGAAVRLLVSIFIIWLVQLSLFQRLFAYQALFPSNPIVESIGLAVCVIGLAFAVWARVHLGRNWGMPMSLKENPELVTTGPYTYVRHPIYTGFLIATLGSIAIGGIVWIIPFIFLCVYFIYSATREEKIMTQQFPNEYPAYKAKTKMLIPFVF